MKMQDVIGELLYIGFGAEKGRCYKKWWGIQYRNTLTNHLKILQKLNNILLNGGDVDDVLCEFIQLCKKNRDIGKFYNISLRAEDIEWGEEGDKFDTINRFMEAVLADILIELNRVFINKKTILSYLRIIHNLPRVYLGKNKKTLCNIHQPAISEKDALKFSYQNMNEQERLRYSVYLEENND